MRTPKGHPQYVDLPDAPQDIEASESLAAPEGELLASPDEPQRGTLDVSQIKAVVEQAIERAFANLKREIEQAASRPRQDERESSQRDVPRDVPIPRREPESVSRETPPPPEAPTPPEVSRNVEVPAPETIAQQESAAPVPPPVRDRERVETREAQREPVRDRTDEIMRALDELKREMAAERERKEAADRLGQQEGGAGISNKDIYQAIGVLTAQVEALADLPSRTV